MKLDEYEQGLRRSFLVIQKLREYRNRVAELEKELNTARHLYASQIQSMHVERGVLASLTDSKHDIECE